MPRIPRGQLAGHAYHVLNRGNGGAAVFHKDGDYTAFLDLLATATATYPVKLFGICLMPNHFPLVVQPATEKIPRKVALYLGVCIHHHDTMVLNPSVIDRLSRGRRDRGTARVVTLLTGQARTVARATKPVSCKAGPPRRIR